MTVCALSYVTAPGGYDSTFESGHGKTEKPPLGAFPFLVRVTGFEPAASWSQTTRATSCATPGRRQKKLAPFRFRGSVRAAKTAYALLPSSSPNRTRSAGLRFGKWGGEETRSISFPQQRKSRENCICAPSFKAFLLYITARGEARGFPEDGKHTQVIHVFIIDVSFQLCYSDMRSVIFP